MREWERGSWDAARDVVPRFEWDYKGEHPEDMDYDPMHTCRICNGPMYFHSMKGNIARYACNGIDCANNPDSTWNAAFSKDTILKIGNPAKIWSKPRQVI